MKYAVALFFAGQALFAQALPIAIGPSANLSLPAVDRSGMTALVSSSVSPDGQINTASDLYLLRADGSVLRRLTQLPNNGASWVDLSSDGSKAAYNVTTSPAPGKEEIHVLDTTSGADLKVAVDSAGCIQPLATAICYGCFFSCIRSVHLSPDAGKVVYSASEAQPLYVVNSDGSGLLHLPITAAVLASSPQRVVSRNGLLVFTTSQEVYVVNLDGSAMQKVGGFSFPATPFNATISEDGGTIAFELQTTNGAQIYISHPDGSLPRQLTNDPLNALRPSISADGSMVAFVETGGQAFIQATDGSGPAVRLTSFRYLTATGVTLSGDASTAMVSVGAGIYRAGAGLSTTRLYAPRAIQANGISGYSGLAFDSAGISPGSLLRITGWNLQDDSDVFAAGVPLPIALGGVSVNVNGTPIPLLSITPTQITAQLPFSAPAGTTTFAFDFDGGQELTASAMVQTAAPELLQYVVPFFSSSYAMAFHAGTGTIADQAHPAAAGETLEMYGTGLGAVSPTVEAGVPGPSNPPAVALAIPDVRMGNQKATVLFAGLAPGLVGIDQVNAMVPSGLKAGSQSVSWSVMGQPPTATWIIWVK